jgi:hypothetical protein
MVAPAARAGQQLEVPVSQKAPLTQLVASVQAVMQAVAPHRNGVQLSVTSGQLPLASQVPALVCRFAVQLSGGPQATVVSASKQPPATSSQSTAPQGLDAEAALAQGLAQQWPAPLMPHTPEMHQSFSAHGPAAICGVHWLLSVQ